MPMKRLFIYSENLISFLDQKLSFPSRVSNYQTQARHECMVNLQKYVSIVEAEVEEAFEQKKLKY